MKIYLFGFVFVVLYFVWRFILKRLNEKADFQKAENKIIGKTIIGEIEEIEFLLKYFKAPPLLLGWKTRIKEKILKERFEKLIEEFKVVIDKK